tara:strand:- start:53356 stop:54765 length:1410 start_codon:yes stop_codon:yes gene_type:complete
MADLFRLANRRLRTLIKVDLFLFLFFLLFNLYAVESLSAVVNISPSQNRCFALFQKTVGYSFYESSQFEVDRASQQLKNLYSLHGKIRSLEDAYVDPDGNLHKLGTSYELRLNSKAYDLIYVFGPPVKKGESYFVNYKLWRKGLKDYVGRDDQVIKQMPFFHFFDKAQENYFKWEVQPGDFVVLDLNSGKNQNEKEMKVFEISEIGAKKIKVISNSGKVLWVSRESLFFDNMGLTKMERSLLTQFFSNGGKGKVFYHQFNDPIYYQKSGLYIFVEELPRGEIFSVPTRNVILSSQKKGLNYLLTTGEHGIHAAFLPTENSFAKSMSDRLGLVAENYIIVTPKVDDSFVIHEIKHYEDYVSGERKSLIQFLEKYFPEGNELGIENRDFLPAYHVINEQRAYATQFSYLRTQDSSKEVDALIAQQIKFFDELYREPYLHLLSRLEGKDAADLAKLLDEFVKSRFIKSRDLN